MKKCCLLLFVLFVSTVNAGLMVTVENDFFMDTDKNYTHGTELLWKQLSIDSNGVESVTGYGIRQKIYTPKDKEVPVAPADQRPYAGTLSATYERWGYFKSELYQVTFELGIMGPDSFAEESQTCIHELIGNKVPEGWDSQKLNEPMLDIYMESHHPFFTVGNARQLSLLSEGIYGGVVGTTFDYAKCGTDVKLGWNIPKLHWVGIQPEALNRPIPFIYMFGEVDGLAVFHNATIGDSFFYDYDDARELKTWVGEAHCGVSAGIKGIALTYSLNRRTREFEGESDYMQWGVASLDFSMNF